MMFSSNDLEEGSLDGLDVARVSTSTFPLAIKPLRGTRRRRIQLSPSPVVQWVVSGILPAGA